MSRTDPHAPRAKAAGHGDRKLAASAEAKAAGGVEKLLSGIGVSQGIAIGPLVAASEPALEHTRAKIAAGGVEAELGRLDDAVAKSRK